MASSSNFVTNTSIRQFLLRYKKEKNQVQTHTWFAKNGNYILSVPQTEHELFMNVVYNYISTNPRSILEDPTKGENALTEKIEKSSQFPFRFFVDIDFKAQHFEDNDILPRKLDDLQSLMTELVDICDNVIRDIYGTSYVDDRLVAVRLPYKLHVMYPAILVKSQTAISLANLMVDRLKEHPLLSEILEVAKDVVDRSVYHTGLRMLGMHKSRMTRKNEDELKFHKKHFGEIYRHCYYLINPTTFEKIPLTLDLFLKSSILQYEQETETAPLNETMMSSVIRKKNGNTRERLPSFQTSEEDSDNLAHKLKHTIDWVKRHYNHPINPNEVKLKTFTTHEMREGSDELVTKESRCLIFSLKSTECMFINKSHKSNRIYILIDSNGSSQRCFDEKCEGKKHNPIPRSKWRDNKSETELVNLQVFPPAQSVAIKKEKDEPQNLEDIVDLSLIEIKPHFPNNSLEYEFCDVTNDGKGIKVPLRDSWCEICKKDREAGDCTHQNFITLAPNKKQSKAYYHCSLKDEFFPDKGIRVNQKLPEYLFIQNNLQYTVNNFTLTATALLTSGDVSDEFDLEDWFDDDELNHLIYESFAANTWSIVKVIHYLAKETFACTNESNNGVWYHFQNHRWLSNQEHHLQFFIPQHVSPYYRRVRQWYQENTPDGEQKEKRKNYLNKSLIEKLCNNTSKNEIIKEAKHYFLVMDIYRDPITGAGFSERLDTHKNLLCFTNGVMDLDTGEFREGRPTDFITMCTNFAYEPDKFDPKRMAIVEKFFEDIQPDVEQRTYLLKFLSSMLHGDVTEELFHIFTGGSANGKSVLNELVEAVLGDYYDNIAANMLTRERPDSSKPQPDILVLRGKRAIWGSEPESHEKIASGFVKLISGNDKLKARLCHSNDLVKFKPDFKAVLLCNDIPKIDDDEGIWRRFRIINFPTRFVQRPNPDKKNEKLRDETLRKKLLECKLEFFILLMKYFELYTKEGRRLIPTKEIQKFNDEQRYKNQQMRQFMDQEMEPSAESIVHFQEFKTRFLAWWKVEYNGRTDGFPTPRKIHDDLVKMDIRIHDKIRVVKNGPNQKGFTGWKFKHEFNLLQPNHSDDEH